MTRQSLCRTLVALAASLFVIVVGSNLAHLQAQGLLVDARPEHQFRLPRPIIPPQPAPAASSYQIEALEVDAKLSGSTARVQVSQTFKNTGSGQIEAQFLFPLPYDGAIDQLTLLVDGKEYPAKLLPKEDARRRYEEIVRSNRDPALLEWVGTGMFQTSVFPIPAGQSRTVTLRYSQLCRQSSGLVDFLFPLSTAKYTDGLLKRLAISVAVDSPADIKNVYSPSHEVKIERPDDRHAVVKFTATDTAATDDFRLFYDTGDEAVAASIVSYRPDKDDDGYFLMLATPKISREAAEASDKSSNEKPAKSTGKTVVFVVDRSGSMSGEKMDQAKEALKFVLNNLKHGDTFNIVAYDSEVEAFRPELQKFDDESRAAATGFVNGLFAGGSTNIDGALARGLGMLGDAERPSYIIFLTDGLPTVGEMNEPAIAKHAAEANKIRARLFAFGVGFDVNSRLIDRLARDNHGRSEYVRPNENIETAVSNLYRRIGAPVMTDVQLTIDVENAKEADGAVASRLYPKGKFDLFAGDQAVIVGRYKSAGDAKATLAGKIAGETKKFYFPAELVAASDDDANAFVAKLWATRRVGEIIDEIDLKGRNEELVKELVDLAVKHGILTPYTSFMADENSPQRELGLRAQAAAINVDQLHESSGEFGFRMRSNKGDLQYAERMAMAPAATPALADAGTSLATASSGGASGGRYAADAFQNTLQTSGRGARFYDAEHDQQVVSNSVISVGRKTFLRHGDRWVDSTLDEKAQKSAKRLERFSDEYFELVAKHGKHVAAYLAIEEPVMIELDGQVYEW
ncbi:VIT domain-containing protein [Lacipirellula sp.]|uniref:VIT domain-containing protein n=1 Tax=Lacipirellula sp. TaxID=2691419 RepID=UPI003D0DAA25